MKQMFGWDGLTSISFFVYHNLNAYLGEREN